MPVPGPGPLTISLQGHKLAINVTCLILASLSVVATAWAKTLIVILLQIDLFKSAILVLVPAIELVHGPVISGSTTCHVIGCVLLITLEACNVAIVLLALHTALNVFRGEGGLYPHRRLAWAVGIVLSLALAFLAFINRPAFVNTGGFCHVPERPRWPKRVLIWLPRGVCLVIIVFTYVATFVYVQKLMRRFVAGPVQPGPRSKIAEPTPPPSLASLRLSPWQPDMMPPRDSGLRPVLTLASASGPSCPAVSGSHPSLLVRPDSSTTVMLSPTTFGASGMAETRDKVRRQLRLLFIYPMVYMGLWTVPLICHIMSLLDRGETLGLSLASIASLSLQGVADALVFLVVEKPWRQPRHGGGASCWLVHAIQGTTVTTTTNAGRSRDEMRFDSRVARRRREGERVAERRSKRSPSRVREWWDVRVETDVDDDGYGDT
ncbi:hypothetical protein CDD80_2260 [Ophiocordyceps camponoti-rufipedis]|uniref:G-protein coupled receptors family 1 profile domain-containing protein n=1 Tax=Ophiocordyceps camponoti-rufipedis TaxID=2004952 RepID=A0A2C5XKK6_9HYPO|nr:hypothetical protein CDD80_2260 [Ophiocordyceps camponoti-rufipedis]